MSVDSGKLYDGVIRLHRLGKPPEELAKGHRFTYSVIASPSGEGPPCLWLDGEHILAGQANRKLVILTIQGEAEKSIDVDDAPAEILSPPRLWRDEQGRVIYSCGEKYFLIDVPKGVASPLTRFAMGNGFEASVAVDEVQRRSVYHDGKLIGQWVFNPFQAESAPGLLAFAYVGPDKNANLGYPDGVAVWNNPVGDWRTIKIPVNDLIGWSR
jgi:hypothetical protein